MQQMRRTSFILILIFNLTVLTGRCEVTKGLSNVLLEPNGQDSFSLTDGVEIICGIPNKQWVEMIVYVPSTKDYFDGTKKLKKGDLLLDQAGNKVCEILSDSVKYMPMHNTTENKYLLRLEGFILLKNIQDTSIRENRLKNFLDANKNVLTYEQLKNFIQQFSFYKVDDFLNSKKYDCYFYYADYFWDNNIHLVFENGNLIAVLHTRDIELLEVKDIQLHQTNLLWLKTNSDKERVSFAKTYNKVYKDSE